MEPIAVAVIGAIGGLASGIAVSLFKPIGEDWQERRRETRRRKRDDLDRMADLIRMNGVDGHLLTMATASIADPTLTSAVGRIISASDHQERSDATGDAASRIGQLRSKL